MSQSTSNLAIKNSRLQAEIEGLKQKNQSLVENHEIDKQHYEQKIEHLNNEYENLRDAFLQAQRAVFGRKTERFIDMQGNQIPLFEDKAKFKDDAKKDEGKNPNNETITYTRKKPGSKDPDLSKLPTREVVISVEESERICGCCGKEKECIGYDEISRLHYIPSVFERWLEKREVLACRKGCGAAIVTAKAPAKILPKVKATEALLAYIVVSKILDRQPLYHLEKKIEQRHHWRIPRNTMARWLIQLSEPLQPLIDLMKEQIEIYDVASIDMTSLRVLNEPGRISGKKSNAICIRGGPPGSEVTLFEYDAYANKDYLKETLKAFEGFIHCDAAPVFNVLEKQNIQLSYCHAHARRKFEKITKTSKKIGLAKHAMSVFRKLYAIERKAKDDDLSHEGRFDLREEKSRPILNEFKLWLDHYIELVPPKSPIGNAINYARDHWAGLLVFLSDGRLEIDNNLTEQDIKYFVMGRKNFLFACTQAGADSLGVLFSLAITAKHHGLNPFKYLESIFTRIPLCKSIEDYEKLLPWNIDLSIF